jgi:hypothetical protein
MPGIKNLSQFDLYGGPSIFSPDVVVPDIGCGYAKSGDVVAGSSAERV